MLELQASSIINAGILDNLKSIIVQIMRTKACFEEESVNSYEKTPKSTILLYCTAMLKRKV